MSATTLKMMDASLLEAAKHLMRAAGQDERLSPREFRQKITNISGEMHDLVEALYRFIVEIDRQGANHITEQDIENAVSRVRKEIFPLYMVAEQVMDPKSQQEVTAIAPKSGLTLALQLYQTARYEQVLLPSTVFQTIKSYTDGLFFDYLASESSQPIEAVHIPCNLTALTQETFTEALGLDPSKPAGVIERFREAQSFFPVFVHQHADVNLEWMAQALVDVMTANLRQINLIVVGEDGSDFGPQHPVYVVGLAADGSLVGFKSTIIWT